MRDNTCGALLGEYNFFDSPVWHCQLEKGHEGLHQASGDSEGRGGKWTITWESDGTKRCHVCGKVIGLYEQCDGKAYKLKGDPKVFVGEDCACPKCHGFGVVDDMTGDDGLGELTTCLVCNGTGLRIPKEKKDA